MSRAGQEPHGLCSERLGSLEDHVAITMAGDKADDPAPCTAASSSPAPAQPSFLPREVHVKDGNSPSISKAGTPPPRSLLPTTRLRSCPQEVGPT